MDELDQMEEYFRLVNSGNLSGDAQQIPQSISYSDVQTTADGAEYEVEVTTSLSVPS